MHKKDQLSAKQELTHQQEQKTATDNQWTSLTNAKECNKNAEKTAENNQWVSTNKNVKE